MQTIPLIEIKKKLATQTERINFARENGYYLPKLPGFDSKFFCQWLSGQKKVSYIYLIIIIAISFRFYRWFLFTLFYQEKSFKKSRYNSKVSKWFEFNELYTWWYKDKFIKSRFFIICLNDRKSIKIFWLVKTIQRYFFTKRRQKITKIHVTNIGGIKRQTKRI